MAATSRCPSEKFDLAFAPQVNEFSGRRTVQLKVLDWRPRVVLFFKPAGF